IIHIPYTTLFRSNNLHKIYIGVGKMGENIERVAMFKKALGNYPTGISVVTAIDENNEPIGLTVNSFASVSIDPLLVLWSIDQNVTTYDTFRKIDKFAINILAAN